MREFKILFYFFFFLIRPPKLSQKPLSVELLRREGKVAKLIRTCGFPPLQFCPFSLPSLPYFYLQNPHLLPRPVRLAGGEEAGGYRAVS